MADNLLECYNPLYDVHLRQYFALPHMQKHLRNLGLLEGAPATENELHAGHVQMMDLMLRNRERVLHQLMELQQKLDAAEKVELYRRIRSGATNVDELNRSHMSRSLSRPARSAARSGRETAEGGGRRRRQSMSPEAGDLIKRVETDYRSDSAPFKNPKSIYNRLAANVYKYQYLHKLDDRTLRKYMNSLRKQLAKLERFREVSFGPHTMAKHGPTQPQQSWFFRRRSLPSLEQHPGANNHHHHPPPPPQSHAHNRPAQANAGRRSLKSGESRKSRSGGKSQSPQRLTGIEPPNKLQRTSQSRTRGSYRLPPLPSSATANNKKRSFATNRTSTAPTKLPDQRLPPTAVIRPTRKMPQEQPRRPAPPMAATKPAGKRTPVTTSRPSSKGSTTPVPVQKPAANGVVLPAIGAAVGAGIAAAVAAAGEEEHRKDEENNRESGVPSPSISLAASQTTTTDGGQPGADSDWEGEKNGQNGDTETRPTPEQMYTEKEADNEEQPRGDHEEEEVGGQLTARPSLHSRVQSPEDEQPPDEPEPPAGAESRTVEHAADEEEQYGKAGQEEVNESELSHDDVVEEPVNNTYEVHEDERPAEQVFTGTQAEEGIPREQEVLQDQSFRDEYENRPPSSVKAPETYPDEIQSLGQGSVQAFEEPEIREKAEPPEFDVESHADRNKREVAYSEEKAEEEADAVEEGTTNYYGKPEWSPREEVTLVQQPGAEDPSDLAQTLDAAESDRIRRFSHPNLDMETGPKESVRSLASSSVEDSLQKEEEQRPKQEDDAMPARNLEMAEEQPLVGGQQEEPEEISASLQEPGDLSDEQAEEEKPASPPPPFEETIGGGVGEDLMQMQGQSGQVQINQPEEEQQQQQQEVEQEEPMPNAMAQQYADFYERPSPVQIEITPSPENRNWDEEEVETEQPHDLEESRKMEEPEHDINGNEMGHAIDEEQRNEVEVPVDAVHIEHEETGNEEQQQQYDEEPLATSLHNEQQQPKAEEEKVIPQFPKPNAGQQEEIPAFVEAVPEEEKGFIRVKREENEQRASPTEEIADQQNVLVESEYVQADEEGWGRKLSGTDTQLELENARLEAEGGIGGGGFGREELTTAEVEEPMAMESMVDSSPLLMMEETPRDPSPENAHSTMVDEQQQEEEMEAHDVPEMGSLKMEEMHQYDEPNEKQQQQVTENSSEEPLINMGTPGEENEELKAEDFNVEDGENSIGVDHHEVLTSDRMSHVETAKEEVPVAHQLLPENIVPSPVEKEAEMDKQDEQNDEAAVEEGSRRSLSQHTGSRPATLLGQPSIEITPASDYGGSVEDNRNGASAITQPASPMSEGQEGENKDHEEYQQMDDDQQLIDFSSSPLAHESLENPNSTQLQHFEGKQEPAAAQETQHHQQNGHSIENDGENNEEEDAGERTSLLNNNNGKTEQHEGHQQLNKLSGASSETEGADEEEEGSEEGGGQMRMDGNNLLDNGNSSHPFQQQQSVKLQKEDSRDKMGGGAQMQI